MRRWLLAPHVRRWWHDDPTETDYPVKTLDHWRAAMRGEEPTRRYLVELDGRPIGEIQSYIVQDFADSVDEVGILDERALGIDLFIGEPDLIGNGHGPALIREFLEMEFDRYKVDYCVIGPATANVAAIRAYAKVGFRFLKTYEELGTTDPPHTLLELHRSDLS